MHAIVFNVTIVADDEEASQQFLRENVVPAVAQAPGFVAGYWVRLSGDKGTSVAVFESEDAANSAAERGRDREMPPGVTIDSVEVGEVVANA